MNMTATATLSTKFQISIPKSVRDAKQWAAGQKFVFLPRGTGVMLVPVPEQEALAGIARGVEYSDPRDRDDRF